MGLTLFLAVLAAAGITAAHYFEVRGAKRPAHFFVVLTRLALLLLIVLVVASTCAGTLDTVAN